MNTIHCFALAYIRHKDNDAILKVFSLEKGFLSLYIRGIYSPKNRKKAYLSPMNMLKITANHAKEHQIPIVKSIEMIDNRLSTPDFRISSMLFFVADFLCQVLPFENENDVLYNHIKDFYTNSYKENFQSHIIFLIKYLQNHGLAPAISEGDFLNPETGNFVECKNGNEFSYDISLLWRDVLSSEVPYSIAISPLYRRPFLESILFYYQIHFPNFNIPKSLDVLYEIME